MLSRILIATAAVALVCGAPHARAQSLATARDVAAIRSCAEKYADNVNEAEQRCIFAVFADPCTKQRGQSSQRAIACYRAEQDIWDDLLNQNLHTLDDGLDAAQKPKLAEMQRAWLADRNATCQFYADKAQGSMATEMTAACLARETARRALLLRFFRGL